MPLFFYMVPLVLGLHCAPLNRSEGKLTTCDSSQQNATLYKMSSINANFAFNLYWRFTVETTDWNIFFSPVSIFSALAMLSLEACHCTQTQIINSLEFKLTDTPMTEIQQGFRHLICLLNFPKKELELQVGNTFFIGKQLKPLAQFFGWRQEPLWDWGIFYWLLQCFCNPEGDQQSCGEANQRESCRPHRRPQTKHHDGPGELYLL